MNYVVVEFQTLNLANLVINFIFGLTEMGESGIPTDIRLEVS
jgi:hypothetical protein